MFFIALFFSIVSRAEASGLDVQLKDLRGSYYYLSGAKPATGQKGCIKLVAAEVKKFGRLTHCDPEQDHVMCQPKEGPKLFVFEAEEACETAAKKGVDPTPVDE